MNSFIYSLILFLWTALMFYINFQNFKKGKINNNRKIKILSSIGMTCALLVMMGTGFIMLSFLSFF